MRLSPGDTSLPSWGNAIQPTFYWVPPAQWYGIVNNCYKEVASYDTK